MKQIFKLVDFQVFSQEKFRAALLKWIVVCDQPYSEPQREAFVEMIKTLNPDAHIVSDKTVHADLMTTYHAKFAELITEVSSVPGKISLTMDLWTSKSVLSFMAIRGHWLDGDWNYQSKLFEFSYVEDAHTGENLGNILNDCLTRLKIPY